MIYLFRFYCYKDADLEGIDGKNQWGSILNNQESKRNSFIYIIDKYGNRFQKKCDLSTEAIRFYDFFKNMLYGVFY